MRAAVFYGPHDIKVEEVPEPVPRRGEVLIKVKVTTICPTDVRKYLGHSEVKGPLILGHEFSGVIEEVGDEVTTFSVGERVTALPFIFCGHCRYCRLGLYNLCLNLTGLGGAAEVGGRLNGSFAEYIKVPSDNVYRLPANVSYLGGSLIEPLAASLNGLLKAELRPTDNVLVIGAGPMGLLQVSLARLLGSHKILVSDLIEERLKRAERLGADVTINPKEEDLRRRVMEETNDNGADIVMLSTGGSVMAKLLGEALRLSAKGARIVVFAGTWPPKEATLDLNTIHYGERKIIGSFIYDKRTFLTAVNIAERGELDLERLITHKFKLEDVEHAFKVVIKKRGLKVALLPKP